MTHETTPPNPPEESNVDANVTPDEQPAVSTVTADEKEAAAAATMHRYVDERPGIRARIASVFADVVLWSFVLACLGYIIFDIEVSLKHKWIVDQVTKGQTLDPATADVASGFLFPTTRMQSQQHGIAPYVEFHGQTVLVFAFVGAVLGLLLNLFNWSFISRAYGLGPQRDGPKPPFWRSPQGIGGSLVLIIILTTGWFVTQIEIWKTTDIRRLQYMSGMVARFFNVFGIEKVDTYTLPDALPVPRDAMPPITPEWRCSVWPAGNHNGWTFAAPAPGEYVFASGAKVIADAKTKLKKGESPDTMDPLTIDAASGARTIPVHMEFPFATLGLKAGDTVTSRPAGASTTEPLIRPQIWQRRAFFRSLVTGDYVFAGGDGADAPRITVTVANSASVLVQPDSGAITEVEIVNGHPSVPPNKQIPLAILGMDANWKLLTAPEGGERSMEVITCFDSPVVGRYEFNEPNVIGYDGLSLPGRRVSVIVQPGAAVPRDADTNEIPLLQATPAWATVQQSPRAWSRFSKAVPVMIETVFLALMATVLAVPLAFVISFMGAQNLMCRSRFGTFVYYCVRTFLNLIRSIEPLCWAIIFGVWVGVGTFAGVLALMVHTIASLAKLYSEQIEGIESGPVEAITATGAGTLKVIRHAVVPQVVPPFISYTMYRWDINVRMAPILGFVGGGGIGMILQQHFNQTQWEEVGVIILLITMVVAAMDIASARIRAKIT